jgi:hypothetical protein
MSMLMPQDVGAAIQSPVLTVWCPFMEVRMLLHHFNQKQRNETTVVAGMIKTSFDLDGILITLSTGSIKNVLIKQ